MEKPTYHIESSIDAEWHFFKSVSSTKVIEKAVVFNKVDEENGIYELIFGDLEDGFVNVKNVSDNQDMSLVLGTVIKTINLFFERNSEKTVIFMGSSTARNRIYRAIISKFISEINNSFEVFGTNFDGIDESFVKEKDYFAFKIRLKR
ncbi:hypothetical protein GCM10027035_28330 [Emticicia sediminis]